MSTTSETANNPGHLAVNFHYIGMPKHAHPGIHGLTKDQFRSSLLELAGKFEILSLEELEAALEQNRMPDSRACVITIDDGLRCQYEHALPVLEELKLPAIFFACTNPWQFSESILVHLLHFIRATIGDQELNSRVYRISETETLSALPDAVDLAKAKTSYRYDSDESARLKYYFNYFLDEPTKRKLLERISLEIGLSKEQFLETYYMSKEMLRDLARRKMLGSHAVTHQPLALLSDDRLYWELSASKQYLESLSGERISAVSYPLGNPEAVSRNVAAQAKKAGYALGWTMERAMNRSFEDPLLFARVDANDISNIAQLGARQRYLKE